MTYVGNRELAGMSRDAVKSRLEELLEEMLQMRAEQSIGGSPSNAGAFKATRRSIARIRTKLHTEE